MRQTSGNTGKGAVALYLVSASAAYPSTFVLREVRELRRLGLEVIIGQLRPVLGRMSTACFDDITPIIVKPRWVYGDFLAGIIYWVWKDPRRLGRCLVLMLRSAPRPSDLIKMLYVLVVSAVIAYQCRNTGVKHIRAHFLHTEALAALFMSDFTGISYSITVHTVATHLPSMLIREVVKRAAFVVADTHQVEEFLQGMGVRTERIHLIRNGVPIDELAFRLRQDTSNPPVVLAAGYLSRKKGFDGLLTACGILIQRGVRFRCVLIGDGDERANLMSLRGRLGLEDVVEMLGDLTFDKLRSWYYRADVFVMPSIVPPDGSTDGLPTVVIEALACGTPVIGADTAGIPEVLVDGKTGILVAAGSAEGIADGIQMLLSHQEQRESLAREGRQLIEREFDIRRNSTVVAHLIDSHATGPCTFGSTT